MFTSSLVKILHYDADVDSTTHTSSEKLFMVHICILHLRLRHSLASVRKKIKIRKMQHAI